MYRSAEVTEARITPTKGGRGLRWIVRTLIALVIGAVGTAGVAPLARAASVAPDGRFVQVINGGLYRIAGGAPLMVDYRVWDDECGTLPLGGRGRECPPIHFVANLSGYAQYPADGTVLLALDTNRLYKVAGGAPLLINAVACGPVVCDRPAVGVLGTTIENLGDGGPTKHLRQFPADHTMIKDIATDKVYKVAGGAPLYLFSCAGAGVCSMDAVPLTSTPNAAGPFLNLRQFPADHTMIKGAETNKVYKIAGGAPLYLTSCAGAGVCSMGAVTVNQSTIDNLGEAKYSTPHLRQFPADHTMIKGAETNKVYKVAGGAPLLLTNCAVPGVCGTDAVTVNQQSIDILGESNSAKHLRQFPSTVLVLRAAETGKVYQVHGGAPLLSGCGCTGGVIVNQWTIDNLGELTSNKHLRQFPADGTFIVSAQQFSIVAGGAPLWMPDCEPCWKSLQDNLMVIDQWTIDNLGESTSNKHLRQFPADGTLLQAAETGRRYVVAGGAPLYPAEACNGCAPVVVKQRTIDQLGSAPGVAKRLRNLPAANTVVQAPSGQQWRLTETFETVTTADGLRTALVDPLWSWAQTSNATNAVPVSDAIVSWFSQANPMGNVDIATVTGSRFTSMRLQGWALDPNTVESIQVRVRVDGVAQAPVLASLNRPDLRNVFSAYGDLHGYDIQVELTPGAHQVCVESVNRRAGADQSICVSNEPDPGLGLPVRT